MWLLSRFLLRRCTAKPSAMPTKLGTASPVARRALTSVRRLSYEGCDLRRPIDTAKAEAAWVTVPMGSSSWIVNTAGSPLAPPVPTSPGVQDSPTLTS